MALSTCTKFGKNVYVDGRVYNPITNEGIQGIPIKLYRYKLDSKDPLGSSSKTLETTLTDANGYYKMEHLSSPFHKVFVQLNSAGNYPIGWVNNESTGEVEVRKGKKNHLDYHMSQYGQIIIHIKNTACVNSNDNVKLYFDGGPYDGYTFNSGLITELVGCIDVTDSPVKSSMGYKYFHWQVTKNNVTTTFYDTIFVDNNQTAVLNVFY